MPATEMIEISVSALEEIRQFAAEAGRDSQVVLEEAVVTGMSAIRRFHRMKAAATDRDVSNAIDILRRAGNEPPAPGDELPEGYRRHA
jgi:hypothetical protein